MSEGDPAPAPVSTPKSDHNVSPPEAGKADEQFVELSEEAAQKQAEFLRERWGVEVLAIRLTANNHMLDFRYKVLDAEKAAPLFVRKTKPRLVHVKTGKVFEVPVPAKTGALRTSDTPKAGRNYWMFFGNAWNLVQHGDRVTVVIGDFKAENLLVE